MSATKARAAKGLTEQFAERALRIRRAMEQRSQSAAAVAELMGWSPRKTRTVMTTATAAYGLSDNEICRLAAFLAVDARWLANGKASPAGAAVLEHLHYLRKQKRLAHLSPVVFGELCDEVVLTPQPDPGFPECRYCHCTEAMACPEGCAWADADYTICTACLAMPEDES